MWQYWRDKKGLEKALKDYYPLFAQRPDIVAAQVQMKSAEAYINQEMTKLVGEQDDY